MHTEAQYARSVLYVISCSGSITTASTISHLLAGGRLRRRRQLRDDLADVAGVRELPQRCGDVRKGVDQRLDGRRLPLRHHRRHAPECGLQHLHRYVNSVTDCGDNLGVAEEFRDEVLQMSGIMHPW